VDHECITLRMQLRQLHRRQRVIAHESPLYREIKRFAVFAFEGPDMGIVYAPYYSLATELAAGQLVPCLKKERCIDLQARQLHRRQRVIAHESPLYREIKRFAVFAFEGPDIVMRPTIHSPPSWRQDSWFPV
jgi:hypothetical protein